MLPSSPPHHWLLPSESISLEDLCMGTKIPLHCICASLRPLCTQLDC